ncbi:two-component system sensor histidine kinase DesK [Isoptericola variabilis J7]|nr:two-component system sensor histidine kinase DesK [Isoptericola variabilis J7]
MAGARGVEVYTRCTMYSFALNEPFFYLLAVAALARGEPPTPAVAIAVAVLAVAHTGLCTLTAHLGLGRDPFATRAQRAVLVALGAVSVALVLVALVALPSTSGDRHLWFENDPRSVVVTVVAAFTLAALSAVHTMGRLTVAAAGATAVVVAARAVSDPGSGLIGLAVSAFAIILFSVASFRLTVWILLVVRELDAARQVSARLAVAEERLRIARDMHDVVGRALSAVAVKSELAAALARRGDDRAADEMLEVRALAQDSLREVRGVVAGYRAPDLATELAGARSVLRAAGIAARVVGEAPALAAPHAEALAWVVREAVTNVVRHSDARECMLRLVRLSDGGTELRIVNDGVVPAASGTSSDGSGIAGLRERVEAVGGTLTADGDGDRFTLTARVPATDPPPAVAREAGAAVVPDPYALQAAGERNA